MKTILGSGRHLIELINDILDISKIEAGHVELNMNEFDLRALVCDVAGMFRYRCEQKSLRLKVEGMDDVSQVVRGDERKLRQILINLLGNAVKFTDNGSVILSVTADGPQRYRFEVCDSGIGIPASSLRGIFEPFQQASNTTGRGGTGLGLAIAKRQVSLMGGALTCESQPGSGSKFFFTLTLPSGSELTSLDPEGIALRLPTDMRVRALVVDDIYENRQVLAEMLRMLGCEVQTCQSGKEAIEIVSGAEQPDIAFVDIMMPGMDGMETARRIISRCVPHSIRLVATTAAALSHEQQRYQAAGFDDVITKPLRCDRVYLSISSLLGIDLERATVSESAPRSEVQPVDLPPELIERLDSAVQIRNITELKRLTNEMENLGLQTRPVVEFLRGCLGRYDLAAVAKWVAERSVSNEPDPASV